MSGGEARGSSAECSVWGTGSTCLGLNSRGALITNIVLRQHASREVLLPHAEIPFSALLRSYKLTILYLIYDTIGLSWIDPFPDLTFHLYRGRVSFITQADAAPSFVTNQAIKFCASKRGATIKIMKMARLSRGVVSLAILFAIFLALEVIAFGITIGLGNPLIYLIFNSVYWDLHWCLHSACGQLSYLTFCSYDI